MELDDKLYNKILTLSDEGETYYDNGEYDNAIAKYLDALALLPNPKEDWEASTWLYATIGNVLFIQEKYDAALSAFRTAEKCPGGIENPMICLMIGESSYELQDNQQAREYLLKAYMLEGEDLFENEDEKYINLISDLI